MKEILEMILDNPLSLVIVCTTASLGCGLLFLLIGSFSNGGC